MPLSSSRTAKEPPGILNLLLRVISSFFILLFRVKILVLFLLSILAYRDGKNFEASDEAKRHILRLYRDDVSRFAAGYEEKVYAVFDGIPGQLSKKEKKYFLSSIHKNARFRTYEDSFIWLNEAMIVNTCYNATENRENHMEIDFLITEKKRISPIEVKSSNYRSHSSLDKFRKKFSSRIGTPYILYPKDIMKKDDIWHLPLYMAMFL